MIRLRDNSSRAKWAVGFIFVAVFTSVISMGSAVMEYFFLDKEILNQDELDANNLRQQVVLFLDIAVSLIAGIVFIRWFRRAYFNLHKLTNSLSHGEGWAAGAWFTPIVNLFRPYQIMKELWDETLSLLSSNDEPEVSSAKTGVKMLGFWWALWIISGVLARIGSRMTDDNSSIEEYQAADIINISSDGLNVLAGVLLIGIIRKYAILESRLNNVSNDRFEDFGKSESDENWESMPEVS